MSSIKSCPITEKRSEKNESEEKDESEMDGEYATAALEAVVVAHWRDLPSSLVREEAAAEEEEADQGSNTVLLSFLFALRSAGLLACPGGSGEAPELSSWLTRSTDSGLQEEVWVEGVRLLFGWVFLSDGPHACLSFLTDAKQAAEDVGAKALAQDKARLFRRLGPALLWGNTFDPEWETIVSVDATVATLCARLRQASVAADEPTTSVLIRCLCHVRRTCLTI
jgi:hypothetical protein